MPALLGTLGAPLSSTVPAGWAAALERLAVRSGPWQNTTSRAGLLAAFRGPDSAQYFENESCLAMLDGFVEPGGLYPADEGRLGAFDDADPSMPGALVARLFLRHGIQALARLTGHFSAVIVDTVRNQVYLVCDSLGARSLFYAKTHHGWAWASDLKSLAPLVDRRVLDPTGLNEVFHYRWLLGETTLLAGVRQVLPSHWVRLQPGWPPEIGRHTVLKFRPAVKHPGREALVASLDEALDQYFSGLRRRHGNICVLLSGGVDSSLLAAKAREHGFDEIITATPRFPGRENPELEQSQRVARHLGLDHRVIDVPDKFIEEHLPAYVWHMEEPPRHYSGLALAKIFQEVAPEVRVVISGEGADTVCGSEKLGHLDEFHRRRNERTRYLPGLFQKGLGGLLPSHGPSRWRALGDQIRYTAREFAFRLSLAESFTPFHHAIPGIAPHPAPNPALLNTLDAEAGYRTLFQEYQLYTMNRSNMLKYDRLATPLNITVEMPFLLPDMLAIGLHLPDELKLENGESKPLLRKLAARYFPREWIDAPKLGFPAPLEGWLEGPLKRWLGLLHDDRATRRGLYCGNVIRKLETRRDAQLLWTAVTLEIFLRQFLDAGPRRSSSMGSSPWYTGQAGLSEV